MKTSTFGDAFIHEAVAGDHPAAEALQRPDANSHPLLRGATSSGELRIRHARRAQSHQLPMSEPVVLPPFNNQSN